MGNACTVLCRSVGFFPNDDDPYLLEDVQRRAAEVVTSLSLVTYDRKTGRIRLIEPVRPIAGPITSQQHPANHVPETTRPGAVIPYTAAGVRPVVARSSSIPRQSQLPADGEVRMANGGRGAVLPLRTSREPERPGRERHRSLAGFLGYREDTPPLIEVQRPRGEMTQVSPMAQSGPAGRSNSAGSKEGRDRVTRGDTQLPVARTRTHRNDMPVTALVVRRPSPGARNVQSIQNRVSYPPATTRQEQFDHVPANNIAVMNGARSVGVTRANTFTAVRDQPDVHAGRTRKHIVSNSYDGPLNIADGIDDEPGLIRRRKHVARVDEVDGFGYNNRVTKSSAKSTDRDRQRRRDLSEGATIVRQYSSQHSPDGDSSPYEFRDRVFSDSSVYRPYNQPLREQQRYASDDVIMSCVARNSPQLRQLQNQRQPKRRLATDVARMYIDDNNNVNEDDSNLVSTSDLMTESSDTVVGVTSLGNNLPGITTRRIIGHHGQVGVSVGDFSRFRSNRRVRKNLKSTTTSMVTSKTANTDATRRQTSRLTNSIHRPNKSRNRVWSAGQNIGVTPFDNDDIDVLVADADGKVVRRNNQRRSQNSVADIGVRGTGVGEVSSSSMASDETRDRLDAMNEANADVGFDRRPGFHGRQRITQNR